VAEMRAQIAALRIENETLKADLRRRDEVIAAVKAQLDRVAPVLEAVGVTAGVNPLPGGGGA
ncbi:MAG TPA: hypothetical protein VM434_18565, partial [Beijerinckiaceae bacterium]|nr:hypothetical protein [Beijerinckiaceae bacterium]